MKKFALILMLALSIITTTKWYSFLAVVVNITDEQIVTIKDTHGNLWQFQEEGWEVNDVLDGFLYNNGTEEIEDDIMMVKDKTTISSDIFKNIA